MATQVIYYETTKAWNGVPKGIRFKVEFTPPRPTEAQKKEGLAAEMGIPVSKISATNVYGLKEV